LGGKSQGGLPPRQLEAARVAVGSVSVMIGVNMFSREESVVTTLLSLVVGTVLEEPIDINGRFNSLGAKMKAAVRGDS